MKAVGIKVLKAKLSEYVRLAKSGETILVTERDEIVAELRPAHRQPMAPAGLGDALSTLADQGVVCLASSDVASWTGFGSRPRIAEASAGALLDELRRDAR
jgi:antitoxin (DNA-binding transcriptional repressor) of toxin-antitoxin stability system